ncbi:Aste57867_8400 [Aphanomyces stellatus]|uniref:Aste57867_8400 protein n=1 Tax=Aphanomyces stellatus TaxID=120398 RepID=A0A485KKC0_9STRA|nr:hypothetical protein As57867_008368 [Aphanomyces stellatus]VFT85286.1 Aste57867_8400 [Aphanomyces stellatus]
MSHIESSAVDIADKRVSISQKGNATPLSADVDHVFQDPDEVEVLEQSIGPLLEACIDGVNACVLCGGSSNTNHAAFFQGEQDTGGVAMSQHGAGLALVVLEHLLALLHEKDARQSNQPSYAYFVRVAFVEFYEESIVDLLSPTQKKVGVTDTRGGGVDFKNVTKLGPITSMDKVKMAVSQGRKRRNIAITAHGPASEFTSAIFRIYVKQVSANGGKVLLSTFDLVDLPPLNRLTKSTPALRLTEAPILNKALYAFEGVCKASDTVSSFPPYDESILTQVLRHAVGGDAMAQALLFLAPNDFDGSKATLHVAALLQKIQNFPLVHTDMIQGIRRRHTAETVYLKTELESLRTSAAGGGGSDAATFPLVEKTHELEGRLLKEGVEKAKLKEHADAMVKNVTEYRAKYQELVESEVKLRKQVMDGEREKLRLSKALVDLQLENGTMLERVEKDKFDLTTKLLNAENDILELQMREEQHEALLKTAQDGAVQSAAEKKELAIEFVALKANFVALNNSFQKESAKSQQLSVELLTLVNQKNKLATQAGELEKFKLDGVERERTLREEIEGAVKREQEFVEKWGVEKARGDKLYEEKVALGFQLKSISLDAEARQLQYEKAAQDIALERHAEVAALKKLSDDELARAQAKQTAQADQLRGFESTVLQLTRQITDLERMLTKRTDEIAQLVETTARQATELDAERNEFRAKLLQLMGEGVPSAEATDERPKEKEALVTELVRSFQAKESETVATIEALKHHSAVLGKRFEALHLFSLRLKRILEDNHVKCDDIPDDMTKWSLEFADGKDAAENVLKTMEAKYESTQQELRLQLEKNIHMAEAYKGMLGDKERNQQALQAQLASATAERDRLREILDKYSQGNANEGVKQMQETLLQQIQDLRNLYNSKQDNGSNLSREVRELQKENAELDAKLLGEEAKGGGADPMKAVEETERRCVELTTKTIMLTEEVSSLKQLLKSTAAKYQRRIEEIEAQYR